MLRKEEYLQFVSDHLAVLESSVRRRGQLGLVDLNLIAETFFADVLNVVYGLKLRNLNLGRNKPGVDLGDDQARLHAARAAGLMARLPAPREPGPRLRRAARRR